MHALARNSWTQQNSRACARTWVPVGLTLEEGPELVEKLGLPPSQLRALRERSALADYLMMPLPPWVGVEPA
jgi:hypothetical protein